MLSANLINNLIDSKERNIKLIEYYKQRINNPGISLKDKCFYENNCILMESENKDIDNILKEYDNESNRKRKDILGVY